MTLQQLNAAAAQTYLRHHASPVIDVIEGHWVFEPDGYCVAYHDEEQLPVDRPGKLVIDYAGVGEGSQPRFNARGQSIDGLRMSLTLDEVVKIATDLGIDGRDVAGRLSREFNS